MPACSHDAVAAPTAELLLRPGVPVVRRDADTLQVGLHPPLAAQVPDVPEVRALLEALRRGSAPGDLTPVAARALDSLLAAGLAFPVAPGTRRPEMAVAQAQFGADGVRRVAGRAGHRIGVRAAEARHERSSPTC